MTSRPTLAVLIGAGASLSAGAPTTAELLEPVLESVSEPIWPFDTGGKAYRDFPLGAAIRDRVGGVYGTDFQFEKVIGAIEEMYAYDPRSGPIVSSLVRPEASFEPFFYRPGLINAYSKAINAIVIQFMSRTQSEKQKAAQHALISFFAELGERYRIVLATLNYDTLLDNALPWYDGFEETADGAYQEFDSRTWLETTAGGERHEMMHLHGSLCFGLRPSTKLRVPFDEPVKYGDVSAAFATTANQGVSNPSADGIKLSATPIIAGGHKGAKLIHNIRPYAFYNATALAEIVRAERLLIMGYGFHDTHVQGWIDEHLRTHPDGKLVLVTRRTREHVGGSGPNGTNAPIDAFFYRMGRGDDAFGRIYVDKHRSTKVEHGPVGKSYLVASGVPVTPDAKDAILSYLEK